MLVIRKQSCEVSVWVTHVCVLYSGVLHHAHKMADTACCNTLLLPYSLLNLNKYHSLQFCTSHVMRKIISSGIIGENLGQKFWTSDVSQEQPDQQPLNMRNSFNWLNDVIQFYSQRSHLISGETILKCIDFYGTHVLFDMQIYCSILKAMHSDAACRTKISI